jgi:hypothetical protein
VSPPPRLAKNFLAKPAFQAMNTASKNWGIIPMANFRRWTKKNNSKLSAGIFILTLILNNFFDFFRLWGQIPLGWVFTVLFIVIFNLHLIPQYWARIWIPIKYGFKHPTKDNYTVKNDYILPFEGKWCVFEGGVTKELSIAWGELMIRYAYFFAVENNLCYGMNVLAVADGVVVKVSSKHSDSPDNKDEKTVEYTGTSDIMGNHIIIRHNKNEYSCVANLMQNSISVKVGDKVKQGDIIAQCGNSGYLAQEPCLHFQLQSSKSFNSSASLPIAFTNIKTEDSSSGNLEIIGNKTYIGRGLDVENDDLDGSEPG